jgi:hypothetical protein
MPGDRPGRLIMTESEPIHVNVSVAIVTGAHDPISESARFILREVLADFEIPARIQHTSVLIIQRQHPELTPRESDYRWAASSYGEQGVPLGRSGRISRTAYEIRARGIGSRRRRT